MYINNTYSTLIDIGYHSNNDNSNNVDIDNITISINSNDDTASNKDNQLNQ